MTEVHQAPGGSKGGDPPADPDDLQPLDFRSPAALRAWLGDLATQIEDVVAAAEDATRPPGRRLLGRAMARRTILEMETRRVLRQLVRAAQRGLEAAG
jgi:hypothetical protein